MGRITPSFRMIFHTLLKDLKHYQEALMDVARRDALNSLIKAWSSELGAMGYARIPSALDVMLLTAVVDNRKLVLELFDKVKALELKIKEFT